MLLVEELNVQRDWKDLKQNAQGIWFATYCQLSDMTCHRTGSDTCNLMTVLLTSWIFSRSSSASSLVNEGDGAKEDVGVLPLEEGGLSRGDGGGDGSRDVDGSFSVSARRRTDSDRVCR